MHRSLVLRAITVAGAALGLAVAATAPVAADVQAPRVTQTNVASDIPGAAAITDPDVVNAWGLALGPTTPLWVANNGSGKATLYSGANGGPFAKVGLTVTIPTGAPTGQVFNGDGAAFKINCPGGLVSARFLFASEVGDISGWAPGGACGTTAVVPVHGSGAVYKGLALLHTPFGPWLLATDFANGRIDVFDTNFNKVTLPATFFTDPRLPAGYAPFGIQAAGDSVYVTYGRQQAGSTDEAHGPGLGFVDKYTDLGTTVERIASHGTLNAPWGMAIAPASFGGFAGDLLVGNFGDGRINVFDGSHFQGQLRDGNNRVLVIDGLWGLLPGTATTGGVDNVWFSAGPNDENDGLVGLLRP